MGILKNHSTTGRSDWDKNEIEDQTEKLLDIIYDYTIKLIAEKKQSVLIVLQGMDASGKDGLTRNLFKKVSPTMVTVHSFKKPNDIEAAHDFLWRIHKNVPEHGMITVFNRSHYEDILVPSVYGYIDSKTIDQRYQLINDFEKMLEANGTKVLKFYMNISHEQQEINLMERVNDLEKHWKHSDGDWATRERWDDFMNVYETIFERCNDIPWHIIPCDKNWTKLYAVAKVVSETLQKMDPQFPALVSERFKAEYEK